MFHKNVKIAQKIARYLAIYVIMKGAVFVIARAFGSDGSLSLTSTNGAPWFVFAMAVFIGLTYLFRSVNSRLILAVSLLTALLAGYDGNIGDKFMLSRVLVFYPFYMLGTVVDREKLLALRRRPALRLGAAAVILVWAAICVFYLRRVYFLRPLFTGRNAYWEEIYGLGALYRLLCMGISALVGLAFLLVVPGGDLKIFSLGGRRTLQIYFWHRLILHAFQYAGLRDLLCATRAGKILWLGIGMDLAMVLILPVFGFPTETLQRFIRPRESASPSN